MIGTVKFKTVITFIATAVIIAVLSVSAYFTGAYAVFYGNSPRLIPIYCVEREEKVCSVTFDCAWGTEYTDKILTALKNSNVRATFFMVEFWAEKYPDYVKKIDESGCEIGTHSSTHSYMSKLNAEGIKAELTTSSEAIKSVTGKEVDLFRAPYGDYDDELIKTASELGYYTIQWDVDSLDWKDYGVDSIIKTVTQHKHLGNGSIILCHNGAKFTSQALDTLIATLKNEGYSFVPISELIYKDNYHMNHEGRQIKN